MRIAFLLGGACTLAFLSYGAAHAADLSDADKAFVAKVSQGGMYEVALARVAEMKGTEQDIKDQANTEAHDHELVGAKLKSIANGNGLMFPGELNADFQARLAKLKALPSSQFDAAYIEDMIKIHDADGAAFAQEASGGKKPALKSFAAETHKIVERHLGELHAKTD
jgi:putative membrane protein